MSSGCTVHRFEPCVCGTLGFVFVAMFTACGAYCVGSWVWSVVFQQATSALSSTSRVGGPILFNLKTTCGFWV